MANVPDFLKSRSANTTNDFLGGIGSSLPAHLSINMNQFALVDGAGNRRPGALTIDVCIIASNPNASRVYYDPNKRYDPTGGDNAPPLCWSDNGVGPSRNAANPQSQTCAMCPNAVWGSATSQITGRGVPACQTGKKVAILVPEDGDDICYMFKIPPASLKNLAQYVKSLAGNMVGSRPCQPSDVITQLSFESQGVVQFKAVRFVDEDTFNRSESFLGQPDAIAEITGRNDVARDPMSILPPGAKAPASIRKEALATIKPPAPAPAPIAAPQPPAEPKKRGRPAKQNDVNELPNFIKAKPQPKPDNVGPGMVEAPAPSSDISAALDNVFNLPGVT